MRNDETIRKAVGRTREKRPLQQLWELRERMLALGVDLKAGKDERIRKAVGRTERRER